VGSGFLLGHVDPTVRLVVAALAGDIEQVAEAAVLAAVLVRDQRALVLEHERLFVCHGFCPWGER
jgi:hypothetical protein